MTDYIKIPTFPTQDLLLGIEAVAPFPKINSHQPRQEGYSDHSNDAAKEKEKRDPRRFLELRSLIEELRGLVQIKKVDLATADSELHRSGIEIIEEKLIPLLLELRIPLNSIDQLVEQIDRNPSRVIRARERKITSTDSPLFPISTLGLSEYNLIIEDLKLQPGSLNSKIVEDVQREGLSVKQKDRLRLSFRQESSSSETGSKLLNLKISVLLGVMESDEAERRAILYPQSAKCFGLYADKRINLSI